MYDLAQGAHELELHLLGSFRIVLQGRDITRQVRPKSRALLRALAASAPSGLSKDALSELLWPSSFPSSSNLSLKVETHNLRRMLDCKSGDGWIIVQDGTYRLNLTRPVWIDVSAFEERYRRGKAAETDGDPQAARAEYEAALALYTGDYLEDDLYDDSTLVARERLKDLHLAILGRLACLAQSARDYAGTIDFCHQIVLADPCREDAYQLLILSHAAMRQYSRAGAWYAVARHTLKRELDRDVSRRTKDVFENLFRQEGASTA